jgi:hypothetical protein
MTSIQQAPQSAHQLGYVIEMQTRGWLVKQKQHAFAGCRLTA